MSSGKDQGSWDLPAIPKKTAPSYTNVYGSSYYNPDSNQYGFNLTPENQAYSNNLIAMRNSLLSQLGITSPQREASLNQWQDTFNKEALRTSMPQLEQTLFGRGLGGSRFYNDAVTDLLSKVSTQGVLNRQTMANADESQKLGYLNYLDPQIQNLASQQNSLMGATTSQGNQDTAQAWEQYKTMLPYLATYNQPESTPWGSIGSLAGAGLGALFALPTGGMSVPMGAALGSSLGGSAGGMFGGSSNSGSGELDLYSLASLLGQSGTGNGISNISPWQQSYLPALGGFNYTGGGAF